MNKILLPVALLLIAAHACLAADADWIQVKSPNFTVLTDAGEKRGREVAQHFEQMRAVFGLLFAKAKVTTSEPLLILAFRNTREFRDVSPLWKGKAEDLAGYFQPGNGIVYIALDLSSEGKWETVFHEYAHNLMNANSLEAPPWFEEGFAEYYSTVKVANDSFVVGDLPENAPEILAQQKWLPTAQLFSVTHTSREYNEQNLQSIFYPESWLAMHFLWFDSPRMKQTETLINLLQNRTPAEDAIRQAYGISSKQLDQELNKFFYGGKVHTYRYHVPDSTRNMTLSAQPIPAVDAQARVAELRLYVSGRFDQAVQDFNRILGEKPDQAVALRGLAYAALHQGDRNKARDYFQRAAALDVPDAHTYYFSAVLLMQMDEGDQQARAKQMQGYLEKAIAIDPSFGAAYNMLAITYAWQQKMPEAVQAASKALSLDHRDYSAALNLAGYYTAMGDFDAAQNLAQGLTKVSDAAISTRAAELVGEIANAKQYRARVAAARQEMTAQVRQADTNVVASAAMHDSARPDAQSVSADIGELQGMLESVQCQDGSKTAMFVVNVGDVGYILAPTDISSIKFSGARTFSCGLKNVKVKATFRRGDSGNIPLTIEFQ